MPVEAVWAAMGSTQAVLMMLFGPSGRRAGEDEVHVVDRGELGLDVVLEVVRVLAHQVGRNAVRLLLYQAKIESSAALNPRSRRIVSSTPRNRSISLRL